MSSLKQLQGDVYRSVTPQEAQMHQEGAGAISRIFDFLDHTVRRPQIALFSGIIHGLQDQSIGSFFKETGQEFIKMDDPHYTFEDVLNAGDVPEFWGRGVVEFAGDLIFDPIWLVPAGWVTKPLGVAGRATKATANFAGKMGYNGAKRVLPIKNREWSEVKGIASKWFSTKKQNAFNKVGLGTTPEGKFANLAQTKVFKALRDFGRVLSREEAKGRKVVKRLAKDHGMTEDQIRRTWVVLSSVPEEHWKHLNKKSIDELISLDNTSILKPFQDPLTGEVQSETMASIVNTVRRISSDAIPGMPTSKWWRELGEVPQELIDKMMPGVMKSLDSRLAGRAAEKSKVLETKKAQISREYSRDPDLLKKKLKEVEADADNIVAEYMSERAEYMTLALTDDGKKLVDFVGLGGKGTSLGGRVLSPTHSSDAMRAWGDLSLWEINDLSYAGAIEGIPAGTKLFIEDPNFLDAVRAYRSWKKYKTLEGINSVVDKHGFRFRRSKPINPDTGEDAIEDLTEVTYSKFVQRLREKWLETTSEQTPKEIFKTSVEVLDKRVSKHAPFLNQMVRNYAGRDLGTRFHVSERSVASFKEALKESLGEARFTSLFSAQGRGVSLEAYGSLDDLWQKQIAAIDQIVDPEFFRRTLRESFDSSARENPIVHWGEQVFRKLSDDSTLKVGSSDDAVELIEDLRRVRVDGYEDVYLPKEAANIVNEYWDVANNPEVIDQLKGWARTVTSAFKITTLAPFPEYHARNFIGNKFNMWLGGMTNLSQNLALTVNSMQLAKLGFTEDFVAASRKLAFASRGGRSAKPFVEIPGMGMIAEEVLGDIAHRSAIQTGVDSLLDVSEKTLRKVAGMKKHSVGVGKEDILSLSSKVHVGDEVKTAKELLEEMIDDGAIGTGLFSSELGKMLRGIPSDSGPLARLKKEMFGGEGSFTGDMLAAGSLVESVDRMALYLFARNTPRKVLRKKTGNIDRIVSAEGGKYLSRDEAIGYLNRYLFNYDSPDKFTSAMRDFAMPFFTWSRYNIPLQLEHLVITPEKAALINKMRITVEQLTSSDQNDDMRYVAEWARQGMAVRTRRKKDGNYEFFALQNWIPFADITEVGADELMSGLLSKNDLKGSVKEGAEEFLSFWINQMSPVIKAPIEGAIGYDFWRGRMNLPDRRRFLGVNLPPRATNAIKNIRALSVLDRFIQPMFDGTPEQNKTFGKAIIRTIGFPRMDSLELKEGQRRHILETKALIRKYNGEIRRAVGRGDRAEAERAHARLEELVKERLEPERSF